MNAQPCARWEAVEQASLASPDALPEGELRDHVAACPVCQQRLGSDIAILQALRASPPPAWSGDGREAIRAALAPEKVTAARRKRRNRQLLGGGLGAAGLATLIVWLKLSTPAPTPATHFELAASAGATYATLASGADTRLRLDDGSLTLHVDHLLPTQAFAIDLPDGRLAVRGTRFTVRVRSGATEEVTVREGRVELWLPGDHRMVSAGERWIAEPAKPALPAPPVEGLAPRDGSDAAPEPAVAAKAPTAPKAAPRTAPPAPEPPPEPTPAPATGRRSGAPTGFPEAVQSFRDRDYANAERALAAFIAGHPDDRRSEDALFLRIRSLQYLGRDAEARAEAARYLNRYPQGLRRPEVEQVVAP